MTDEEPRPEPASKRFLADRAVAGAEAQLLMDIRDLAVIQLRLRLARENRDASAENVSDAAQSFRTAQRKVNSMVEELTEKHINAIKVRAAEPPDEEPQP